MDVEEQWKISKNRFGRSLNIGLEDQNVGLEDHTCWFGRPMCSDSVVSRRTDTNAQIWQNYVTRLRTGLIWKNC